MPEIILTDHVNIEGKWLMRGAKLIVTQDKADELISNGIAKIDTKSKKRNFASFSSNAKR